MRLRFLAFLGLGVASLFPAPSWAENICSIPQGEFGSCSANNRAFRSVVLAIHGWSGSCAETFGNRDESLLRTLGRGGAFDIDCFSYDTHDTPITTSANQLRDRIRILTNLGYDEFLFVTHSMGGIVLLQMLMDDALTEDGTSLKARNARGYLLSGKTHIAGIHAWATPIKGLRDGITTPGSILTTLGFSAKTLPELSPGSDLLSRLNARLLKFFGLRDALTDPGERSEMALDLNFYQGQSDDWVVITVPTNDPLLLRNPDSTHILNTSSGHSHNVANGGTVALPTYPQELLRDKALLSMRLEPRLDEVFLSDVRLASAPIVSKQKRIIEGTLHYCDDNFLKALAPTAQLVAKFLTGQFVRSADLDFNLIDRFARLIEDRSATLVKEKDFLHLISLYRDIVVALSSYEPKSKKGPLDFGQGSSPAIERVMAVFNYIIGQVKNIRQTAEAQGISIDKNVLAELEVGLLNTVPKYLYAGHDSVRTAAIDALQEAVRDSLPEAVEQSNVAYALTSFAVANAVNLPGAEKKKLADTLVATAERAPSQSGEIFAALVTVPDGRSDNTQVWAVMMDNGRVDKTLAYLPRTDGMSDAEFKFVAQVIKRGGASGNSSSSALSALSVAQDNVEANVNNPIGAARLEQLRDAVGSSVFSGGKVTSQFGRWQANLN